MSYRLDGDSAEFLAAIEDVVADQADALNISLGHSRWLTTDPEHDPIREALDAAVDAGVIVAASSGNAGANGDTSITGSWKLSPKVITVANSSHARVFSNPVSVTGPGTVPASLTRRVGRRGRCTGAADRGHHLRRVRRRAGRHRRQRRRGMHGRCRPGSITGKIALVAAAPARSTIKKNNAMAAGATALIVHNNSPDAAVVDGVTPPRFRVGDGHAQRRPRARGLGGRECRRRRSTSGRRSQRLTSGWPDVVAGSSSRGPAADDGDQARHRRSGLEHPLVGRQRHDRRRRSGRPVRAGQRDVDGDAAHHRAGRADEVAPSGVDAGAGEECADEHGEHVDVARPRGQRSPRSRSTVAQAVSTLRGSSTRS